MESTTPHWTTLIWRRTKCPSLFVDPTTEWACDFISTGCIVVSSEERLYLRNYKWDYVAICEWTTPLAMESNSTLVEEKTVLRSR